MKKKTYRFGIFRKNPSSFGKSPTNSRWRKPQFAAMVGVIVTSAFGTLYLERQLKASSKDGGLGRTGAPLEDASGVRGKLRIFRMDSG